MAYFPADRWDSQAVTWDDTLANKSFPHYFYYYEADLYIHDTLAGASVALEVGAGTCGSTLNHASDKRRVVAIDYSRTMLEVGIRKLRTAGLVDFVDIIVADACYLPLRNTSFDAVFTRGVAICYAAKPEGFVREARRVLRAAGRLGLDFMNKTGQSRRKLTRIEEIKGKSYYVEIFSDGDLQRRIGYELPTNIDAKSVLELSNRRSLGSVQQLGGVKLEGLPTLEWWARLYSAGEMRQLLRNAGFRRVKMLPLGSFTRGISNPKIREFLIENRDELSKVQKEMADIFKLNKAVHIFSIATAI